MVPGAAERLRAPAAGEPLDSGLDTADERWETELPRVVCEGYGFR